MIKKHYVISIKNYINNKHSNYNFIFKSKHNDSHIFNCTIKHFLQNNEK